MPGLDRNCRLWLRVWPLPDSTDQFINKRTFTQNHEIHETHESIFVCFVYFVVKGVFAMMSRHVAAVSARRLGCAAFPARKSYHGELETAEFAAELGMQRLNDLISRVSRAV
jgi:hypothetical protein